LGIERFTFGRDECISHFSRPSMKKNTHRQETDSAPDNLWQAALHVVWGWRPIVRNSALAVIIICAVVLVLWSTLPEKTKSEILGWRRNSNRNDVSSTSGSVEVDFDAPNKSYPFKLTVTNEKGTVVSSDRVTEGTSHKLILPSGSYSYSINLYGNPTPLPCFTVVESDSGVFTLKAGNPQHIQLKSLWTPIPNCKR